MKAATLELWHSPQSSDPSIEFHPGLKLNDRSGRSGPRRRSIIFPLKVGESLPLPEVAANYRMLLFGGLQNTKLFQEIADSEFRNRSYFSVSATTFVSILDTEAEVGDLINKISDYATHWEQWVIEVGKVTRFETSPDPFGQIEELDLFQKSVALPKQTEWLVAEAISNIKRLSRKINAYFPSARDEFLMLREELTKQIRFLEITSDEIRALISDPDPSEELMYRNRLRYDKSLEYLTQFNASLVYANSQFAHGLPPVMQTLALIRPHSLLGTGNAWKAVFLLYRQLFDVFRNAGHTIKVRRALWQEGGNELYKEPLKARVIYFSARNGFSEDDTSISFAAQSIPLCSTADRTLMTITHEVLHSHVKHLFAAAFMRRDDNGTMLSFDESLLKSYVEYFNKIGGRRISDITQNDFANSGEYINFQTIHACVKLEGHLWEANSNLYKEPANSAIMTIKTRAPADVSSAMHAVNQSLQIYEELLVHSLDFRYFYNSDPQLYCDTVWTTWAALPRVISKIEMYALRVLVAVATSYSGKKFERLDAAKAQLLVTAEKLSGVPETALIGKKLHRIVSDQDPLRKQWLDLMFPAVIDHLDALLNIFSSGDLENEFRKVSGDDGGEEEEFDFLEEGIPVSESKIACVREMLKNSLMQEGMKALDLEETARRSALFLLSLSNS